MAPERAKKMSANSNLKQKIKKGNNGKFQGKKERFNKHQMQEPVKKAIPKPVTLEIEVPDEISVGELASRLKKTAVDVIKKLMSLGQMASVSDIIDFDTACIVAEECLVSDFEHVVNYSAHVY